MKRFTPVSFARFVRSTLVATLIGLVGSLAAHGGLTVDIHTYRYNNYFVTYGWLSTNATPPAAPLGDYLIRSGQYPGNGTFLRYRHDAAGFNYVNDGGGTSANNFDSFMNALTNGQWSIQVTNASSTNTYDFNVSATGLNSNLFRFATVTFPANHAQNVTADPTFTWTGGPIGWRGTAEVNVRDPDYNYYESASLPPSATSWNTPNPPLPLGTNVFHLVYLSNASPAIVASTPLDPGGNPIAGWISTAHLDVNADDVEFTVGGTGNASLFGHYTFDEEFDLAHDSSGLNNDAVGLFYPGNGTQLPQFTSAGISGGAVEFDGFNALWWESDMVDVLAGSYTISLWVETTQSYGSDNDDARDGATIFAGDDSGDFPVPMALTGDKVGFFTADPSHTIHSGNSINSGDFTHLVVTRDATTGIKRIYVDGVLDTSGTGGTFPGIDSAEVYLGYSYYSDQGIEGVVDDLQVYTAVLDARQITYLYNNPGEVVSTDPDPSGHTLEAHYSFENGSIFATDYSGHGNNVNSTSSTGGGTRYTTNNPALGNFAAYFSNNGGAGGGWLNPSNALLATLADSFTLSLWVQTTQVSGNDTDSGLFGNAGLVSAFTGPGANWVVPMALTGNKLAFATAGSPQHTLHSTVAITNGSEFVHLVVSRNRLTGEKKIYVNGALDVSSTGSTDLLDSPTSLRIGYNNGTGLQGVMDEIQFYAGVLSDAEVAFLYANPGSTVPDGPGGGGGGLAEAVDAPQLAWTTGGDANWFVESSKTHDNVDAAQSGAIGNDKSSWIQTTIIGPGTLSFWWNVDSDDSVGYDYLEFAVDGFGENSISGDRGWDFYSFHLDPGSHTVRWTYFKDSGASAGLDAAWLDEVSFVPDTPPVITFQPIDQTNYSGYPVNLVADASGVPEPNWQWYKAGTGLIPGANSRYYSPTNSGTAGVAGSYYAIANNSVNSATTRTAVVTFVSAPLPPDWSKAFNAQLTGDFDQPRTNYGIACLVDASSNIYSANSFTGTNDFGSAGAGRFAAGLFKYTPNGAAIWGRAITNNGNGNSYPQCLARAPGDGVYMSGVFLGTNGLGTNLLQETAGASLYLVRFDSAGNVIWVRTFGGTNAQFQSYHQLVSDPAGNVTISALGNNLVNFGTTNILLNGQKGLLAQYDADGNVRWIEKPSGWVHYLTYDSGRIYAAFAADGSGTNRIGGVTNTTDRRWTMAALNATNGQAFWLQGFGSALGQSSPVGASDDLPAVSVSGTNIFLTGGGWGSGATFGAYSVSWPASNGQYFARYDTNGNAQLAVSFGGTNVWPWAAVADASGNVYVTGDFDGYAAFGNKTIGGPRFGTAGSVFYGQLFLAKFDRNGNSLWVRQSQTHVPNSFLNVRDLNLAADGVWVCGFVNQTGNFGTHPVNGPVTCIGSPFCTLTYYVGGVLAKVTEGVASALPVTLINAQIPGSTFQFQFQFLSQAGRTNIVQSRTNLMLGGWVNRTNILGDGTMKTVLLPIGSAPSEFFRVSTQ